MASQASPDLVGLDRRLRDVERALDPQRQKPFMTSTGALQVGVGRQSTTRLADSIIEQAFGSVESLQSVLAGTKTFDLSAVTSGTISADQIRPDPVVGEVYRYTVGGFLNATNAVTLTLSLTIPPTTQTLMTITSAGGNQPVFFGTAEVVCILAGAGGTFSLSSWFGQTNGPAPFSAQSLAQIGAYSPAAGIMTAPVFTLFFSTGGLAAASSFVVTAFTLESLGFRKG